jgi:hypothetical protein
MTTRVYPTDPYTHPITVNGRLYTPANGVSQDVPDHDAAVLTANGWMRVGLVGTTAQRPAAPANGDRYVDTTVGALLFFDGKDWHQTYSGAAA